MSGANQRVRLVGNPAHFYGDVAFDHEAAARATARCVARFATRYAIWPVGWPDETREGDLPRDPAALSALLDELWAWVDAWWRRRWKLEPMWRGYALTGLVLEDAEGTLLDQHDGDEGWLRLTPDQVRTLRECWGRHSRPSGPGRSEWTGPFPRR